MDDSPIVGSTQQPMVGWDMESPDTTTVSPRSIMIPWPTTDTNSSQEPSPAGRMTEWAISYRNKRRMRRGTNHETNVFKRYGLLNDTPEKAASSGDDFDDDLWDDETIAKIRLTPILQAQKMKDRVRSGGVDGVTKSGQAFKTPTNVKSQCSRRTPTTGHEGSGGGGGGKVLRRKLTTEFECVKKTEQQRSPPSTLASRFPDTTSTNTTINTASKSSTGGPITVDSQGSSPRQSGSANVTLSERMITTKQQEQEQKQKQEQEQEQGKEHEQKQEQGKEQREVDEDEAMLSGDDDIMQQAVQGYLASQHSQQHKISPAVVSSGVPEPVKTSVPQPAPQQATSRNNPPPVAPCTQQATATSRNNPSSVIAPDDSFDSDDAMMDDFLTDEFISQLKVPEPSGDKLLHTPPNRTDRSPEERKRARLSLSLRKSKTTH